ncbi:hypothetical protein COZ40_01300 [Candidatus Roizmanbacteria bacterium CG_4_10_14_3_um_filter_39_13]|uniref:DUF4190 domain-containing protein n=3 Tax=Candidatus Roizmaniibacteriota TaxID=1752723 RepID=A0A2M7EK27_9BACT|nr:MAG: hypothetical protein COS52_02790 [Candidatus Roizmanbacteria bacterium CG03_land_8_20_14_0_80_39_12]PIV70900.1 MAG: hypothetical protein COW57_02680 [Candidatus Roizmanbacteria bacterium CG17_big_fil_post_rev_8_21_14_2_50_39_7]PIX68812.1 MAG: hypothetical protein COZ40_01300 [Candidatus Roizmanbacteria bacterium CG_4_10_14_3_um_filter_39_13]
MRRIIAIIFVLMVFAFVAYKSAFAASTRYATCDACGLCPTVVNGEAPSCTVDSVPGDWKRCVKCLYPEKYPSTSDPDPSNCDTLLIDDATNLPQSPVKVGRQFTMLGCITSGTGVGFKEGAPSFVQALLNVIFSLSGGLAFLYLMYGGFIILTSQADPEKLNYGRRLVTGSIVGLVFTIGSVFMVNLIGSGILHIPGFSGATP